MFIDIGNLKKGQKFRLYESPMLYKVHSVELNRHKVTVETTTGSTITESVDTVVEVV